MKKIYILISSENIQKNILKNNDENILQQLLLTLSNPKILTDVKKEISEGYAEKVVLVALRERQRNDVLM